MTQSNVNKWKSALAISIEGIGREGTPGESSGILWATDALVELTDAPSGWDYEPYLQVDGISPTSTTVDIFRGRNSYGAFTISMEAVDETVTRFMFEQRRAAASVQSDVAIGDASIDIDDGTLEDTIIYVGEETIKLGAITSVAGGVYTYQAIRGHYGSRADAHVVGNNVFVETPFWEGRSVKLWTLEYREGSWALEQRWVGRIDGQIEQTLGALKIKCRETAANLLGLKRGRANRRFDSFPKTQFYKEDGQIVVSSTSWGDYEPKIVKPDTPGSGTTEQAIAFQVKDQVVVGKAEVDVGGYRGRVKFNNSTPLFEQSFGSDTYEQGSQAQNTISSEDVVEVFAADRRTTAKYGGSATNFHPFSSFLPQLPVTHHWHPLLFYAAFHLSRGDATLLDAANFDVLRDDWALDLGWLFVDGIVERITHLINQTPSQKVDQIQLGRDAQPAEIRRYCKEEFLRPWGWVEGTDNNGLVTIRRMTSSDVQFYQDGLNNKVRAEPSDTLVEDNGGRSNVDAVEVQIGGLEGITEGTTIFVQAADNDSIRPSDLKAEPDISYSYKTIRQERQQFVRRRAVGFLLMQHFGLPTLTIKAEDHLHAGKDYSIGAKVTLEDLEVEPAWLMNSKTGERVQSVDDSVEWSGYIIGRRFRPRERTYELTLLLSGHELVRWRAPSGVIQSSTTDGNGNRVITLGQSFGDTDEDGNPVDDASRFTEGDEILIWSPDGSQKHDSGDILEVQGVSGADLVLSGNYGSAPPTGWIVELAWLETGAGDGYSNDGLAGKFSAVERVYAYLSDTQDTLGDGEEDADTYGVGI